MPLATSSGLITAPTTQVKTGSHRLLGLILVGGSAASTVTVYDGTANTDTAVAKFVTAANTTWSQDFEDGVIINKGIYVEISGTGAGAIVHFSIA